MTLCDLHLEHARALGETLATHLRAGGVARRVSIVGSVRRQKPIVGDVELLVEPNEAFWNLVHFDGVLDDMGLRPGPPNKAGARAPNGPRYYKRAIDLDHQGERTFQVDIFVCLPPAEWGILELIRTGDKDFSQAMVKRLWRIGLQTQGAQLVPLPGFRGVRPFPTPPHVPDEASFFGLVTVPFLEPELREWSIETTRKLVEGP